MRIAYFNATGQTKELVSERDSIEFVLPGNSLRFWLDLPSLRES